MSSALRLAMILVLALATAAIGLIASTLMKPKPVAPTEALAPAPVAVQYLTAARSLPVGALLRDEDVAARPSDSGNVPPNAIVDTSDARAALRGSLVRKFLDTGEFIAAADVLRPRDRGFLATVLAPNTRAVSINVDVETGVSGLIWPGDLVDVVLTQANDKADPSRHATSETVLRNIRVVATDQEIVPPVPAANSAAAKVPRSVSLQLTPEQVKVVAVAREMGKLSLAMRSAVDRADAADSGAMLDCDVSQEAARRATVSVYAGGRAQVFSVRKDGGDRPARGCDPGDAVALGAAVTTVSGDDRSGEDRRNPEDPR